MRKPRTKIQELRPNHFHTRQRLLLTRPDLKTIIAKGPEVSVLVSQVMKSVRTLRFKSCLRRKLYYTFRSEDRRVQKLRQAGY